MEDNYSEIPVVAATDNNFIPLAAALIKSIEVNSYHDKLIFYLLCDRVSILNKTKLNESTAIEIRFIDIGRTDKKKMPNSVGHITDTAYLRLIIPDLFSSYERVIYLDVDMLVLADLSYLMKLDFENNWCMAVQCSFIKTMGNQNSGLYGLSRFNIDPDDKYFNSGMLVIDIKKWIENNVRERTINALEIELRNSTMMDQAGLNIVLHNHWKQLKQEWNCFPDIADSNSLPKIMHFNGYKPIYTSYKGRHKSLFYFYLNQTKWAQLKYGLIKKIMIRAPQKIKLLSITLLKRVLPNKI